MSRRDVERLGAMAPYYAGEGAEMVSERVVLLLGWDPGVKALWLLDVDLSRKEMEHRNRTTQNLGRERRK